MSRRILTLLSILPFGLLFVLNAGCGSDADVTDPGGETHDTGTIEINQTPDALSGAGWTLTGPQNDSGSGEATLSDMPLGQYTQSWDSVSGYITPSSDQQSLTAGGTITFSGVYSEAQGPVQGYVLIPPASVSMPVTFTMGSTFSSDEIPHQVTLTDRFNMARTEVTNGQYMAALQWAYNEGHVTATTAIVRDNLDGSTADLLDLEHHLSQISFSGSVFSTSNPDSPVGMVSWYGSVAYCDWLSMQDGLPRAYDHSDWSCNSGNPYSASGYRLPTEAEWEFACRAGTTTHFNTGDCLDAGTEANYYGGHSFNSCPTGPDMEGTTDVGSYPASQWGLFDIHGNVFEWCNDWYLYYNGNETDPVGPVSGSYRVLRGGSYLSYAQSCRSARRHIGHPNLTLPSAGFRPVRSTF